MLTVSGIVGVVSEPETRTVGANGNSIVDFRAVVNNWLGGKDVPTWMTCYIWDDGNGKTAKFIKDNLKKGSRVQIAGKLENDEFLDKDGNKRTALRIHLFDGSVRFAGDAKKKEVDPPTTTTVETKTKDKAKDKNKIEF
jgi:single-stranded DNA-binding protein